jgi:transcription antitermination factor NusG
MPGDVLDALAVDVDLAPVAQRFQVLGAGERPLPVPNEVIISIQERAAPLGFIRVGSPFEPGTPVRVLDGPLAGLNGLLERPTSRDGRVRVLLEILNQRVPIEMDALALERA